uniref:Sodium/calcium exchanger membrane region domain-containing protein n=1 Tax=Coccolithus braarudii TaxID=221442 RepID=A0A6T7K5F6_9EUKA
MIAPFQPHRRPLLRDIGFYCLGVILMAVFILDGKTEFYEALILALVYIFYVFFVLASRYVFQRWKTYQKRLESQKQLSIGILGAPASMRRMSSWRDNVKNLEEFAGRMNLHRVVKRREERINEALRARKIDPDTAKADMTLNPSGRSGMVQAVLKRTLESDESITSTHEHVLGYMWAWHHMQQRGKGGEAPGAPNVNSDAVSTSSEVRPAQSLLNGSLNAEPVPSAVVSEVDDVEPKLTAVPKATGTEIEVPRPLMARMELPKAIEWVEEATGWAEKGTLSRLSYPLELIFIFARDLTVPLLEEDRWNRTMASVATVGALTFIYINIFPSSVSTLLGGAFPEMLLPVVIGLVLVPILRLFLPADESPTGWKSIVLLLVGFASAITWTNALANELVASLEFLGGLLGISPGILGLTVLAWGNSLGDFIADTSLARAGNPRMGAASCFGSPLFNLLIGFGASVAFATAAGNVVNTPDDDNIPVALGFLIGSCVLSAVIIPANGFHVTYRYGVFLICYYLIFLIISLLVELNVIGHGSGASE